MTTKKVIRKQPRTNIQKIPIMTQITQQHTNKQTNLTPRQQPIQLIRNKNTSAIILLNIQNTRMPKPLYNHIYIHNTQKENKNE